MWHTISIGVGTGGAGGALAPQYGNILYYFRLFTIINHSLQPSAPQPKRASYVNDKYMFNYIT